MLQQIEDVPMLDSIRRRFQIDWLVSNLRWVLLLVVVGVAFLDWQFGLENPFFPHLLVLLGVAAVYNLALTLLLVARLFPRPLPVISLGIDAVSYTHLTLPTIYSV